MIQSSIELRVTVKKLKEFKDALGCLRSNSDIDPLEIELRTGAIQSQIDIFEDDIREYLYRGF
jgi:hypothetical protein